MNHLIGSETITPFWKSNISVGSMNQAWWHFLNFVWIFDIFLLIKVDLLRSFYWKSSRGWALSSNSSLSFCASCLLSTELTMEHTNQADAQCFALAHQIFHSFHNTLSFSIPRCFGCSILTLQCCSKTHCMSLSEIIYIFSINSNVREPSESRLVRLEQGCGLQFV